ncbi:hypothetical protein GGQ69_001012 [Micrococcus sp. TA1]|nr:hypothetical protein [Micrococcus sp. TA1]
MVNASAEAALLRSLGNVGPMIIGICAGEKSG